jgi:hypothetical protein
VGPKQGGEGAAVAREQGFVCRELDSQEDSSRDFSVPFLQPLEHHQGQMFPPTVKLSSDEVPSNYSVYYWDLIT